MLFTLEALDADHGDALLLHYGDPSNPKLIIIDGGPGDVYELSIEPRLQEYRDLRGINGSIPVKLVMVSHIDRDHIIGLVDLFENVEEAIDDGDTPLIRTNVLWHNGFDDIIGNNQVAGVASFGSYLATHDAEDEYAVDHHSLELIAGVPEGQDLRDLAARLALGLNRPFDRFVQERETPVNMGNGLTLQVLGPRRSQLSDLQDKWDDKIASLATASLAQRRAEIADFSDSSIANLASIVVLARAGNKTMLLTGDARGDFILKALRRADLLENGKAKFDLLKVPHHGSDRNVDTSFFRKVEAKHYVFSGNGKHGNPDWATLSMLTHARGSAKYTMHFTYRLPHIEEFVAKDKADFNRNYEVVYREDDYYSVWVDLDETFDF